MKHEQADGRSNRSGLKKVKRRIERRRAKHNPECQPQYRRYSGYQS